MTRPVKPSCLRASAQLAPAPPEHDTFIIIVLGPAPTCGHIEASTMPGAAHTPLTQCSLLQWGTIVGTLAPNG
ncbi:hypothetical protein E2C01_101688 [Portunus trituberculatus]|uniref:Uncharacterized protein n=1 Tax=Portunus trituberculatus TaxID=210409 RepID=A0A5B7KGC4_PORTR|nr:hypothetical protein [Portunus trituberculatus]